MWDWTGLDYSGSRLASLRTHFPSVSEKLLVLTLKILRRSATRVATLVLPAVIKMMLTIQTSISLQVAVPHGTRPVSLSVYLIASYQSSQSDELAWTATLQPLLYS